MQDNELYQYPGSELELFSAAKNWKQYVTKIIKPYIYGDLLEVGAGIGTNTLLFFNNNVSSIILLEPDKKFCDVLQKLSFNKSFSVSCSVINGYISDIPTTTKFDTILYIDVLEHIEDDIKEIEMASCLLKQNGKLIVLSPAHMYLMSPFDKAIGHFRRYSKKSILSLVKDKSVVPVKCIYVDSVGLFASFANKYFLKQKYPGNPQIAFWDNWMIPLSTILDRALQHKVGKTIIAVWEKK